MERRIAWLDVEVVDVVVIYYVGHVWPVVVLVWIERVLLILMLAVLLLLTHLTTWGWGHEATCCLSDMSGPIWQICVVYLSC